MQVAIIGGGIVGACAALAAQREGFAVVPQGIHRVGQKCNLPPLEHGLRRRQRIDFLTRVPGFALRQPGWRLINGHPKLGTGRSRPLQHWLEITSKQALRPARQGIDPVGLQPFHQPGTLLLHRSDAETPHLTAKRRKHRTRSLATLEPGVPGLVQRIKAPARQFAPRGRHPARARAFDR